MLVFILKLKKMFVHFKKKYLGKVSVIFLHFIVTKNHLQNSLISPHDNVSQQAS